MTTYRTSYQLIHVSITAVRSHTAADAVMESTVSTASRMWLQAAICLYWMARTQHVLHLSVSPIIQQL